MRDLLINVLGEFVWAIIGVVAVWLYHRIFIIFPTRSLWRLSDPEKLTICVATSSREDTGVYHRAATGIGQVRALAIISPSLRKAYKNTKIKNIILSDESIGPRIERDLILLGGPKNNQLTKRFLDEIQAKCPVEQTEKGICWTLDKLKREMYSPKSSDKQIKRDYGLIIRIKNPFTPRNSTVYLFSGGHTYGVVAAATYFTTQYDSIFQLKKLRSKTLVTLVSCDIEDDCPVNIKLVREFAE